MNGKATVEKQKEFFNQPQLICPNCGSDNFDFVCHVRKIPRGHSRISVSPVVFICCSCSGHFTPATLQAFDPTPEEQEMLRHKASTYPPDPVVANK